MTTRWLPLALMSSACVGEWTGPVIDDSGVTPLLEEARAFFIYPGSNSDFGWTQSHDDGRVHLEDKLGMVTDFAAFTSGLDADEVIQTALDDDYNVIVTASSDYIPATLSAANNNTEDYFLSCCGSFSSQNLTSFFGRMYQPLYVAGTVAAEMTCTNKIGVVAAKSVPQFIRHINAFTLGARSVNPDVEVEVIWLDSFFNPDLETQSANDLVDSGNDVLLVQTNSTIVIEQSAARTVTCGEDTDSPVYSVGYHNVGACDVAPDRCITSAYWNWAPMYENRIKSLLDGSWDPTDVAWQPWLDGDDSVVQLREWPTFVPGNLRIDADALAAEVRGNSVAFPFEGPVTDNTGTVKIAAGDSLDDEQLDRICWFVDGVVNSDGDPAVVPTTCPGDR